MKLRFLLVMAAAVSLFALPMVAHAEETVSDESPAIVYPEPDLAADATATELDPPTIPHAIQDDADGTSCNTCHTGSFKAPHPDRLNCTQCHVPGKITKKSKKAGKPARK